VSEAQLLVLGAIAGGTIFLGLPMGRGARVSKRTAAFLNAAAAGVLVFLLIEVTTHAVEPVEEALTDAVHHGGSWAAFAGKAALFACLFALGALGLVMYDRWLDRRSKTETRFGPGAASIQEFQRSRIDRLSDPQRLALFIALGIGLHNFSEGLAIGQSAASGEVSLAWLLIIGFGLHNATEGFGIVAPMTAEADRPSWAYLGLLGVIGGGPTFLGTLVGQAWVNEILDLAFLALAGGSILYVVVQLLHVADRLGHKELLMWGLVLGIFLGYATDFVLVAAGV
jgi:zinc transporter, ZIP family